MTPRYIRTVTAEVIVSGTWYTVTGWDAPVLLGRNPDSGVLRIFSGEEPEYDKGTLTEMRIRDTIAAGLASQWYFGEGKWSRAHFGPLRD
jgi:hypothetical protein